MRISGILLLSLFFYVTASQAQKKPVDKNRDTVNTRGDTTSVLMPFRPKSEQPKEKVYHPDSAHSPHKAVIKSLRLPGTGQMYNRQYWKLPLIYGGFIGLGYSYYVAQTNYKEYLKVATAIQRGEPVDEKYENLALSQITPYVDFYNRNRSVTIIIAVAFWGIQAIDAYIDAKFQHTYTMDNNLGFKVTPALINGPAFAYGGYVPGLKLTLKMR